MARLIDADKVEEKMRDTIDMQDVYLPIHFKEWIIDDMPTVEAIPIEWIKEWAMKSENTYNREQIIEMLNDWEKENDR